MTDWDAVGTVYLIHFDRPFGHAKHYLGWSGDLERRLAEHASGHGAKLMAYVRQAGITWRVSRLWTGTLALEFHLKKQGGRSRMCPLCKELKPCPPRTKHA